jgi:hypothetical protein
MQIWDITFWKPTVIFNFHHFIVEYNPEIKTTYTRFPDNHWTGGDIVEGDWFHAPLLDLTPELHRLQHELAHSLIGTEYYGLEHSAILFHAAHADEIPLPDNHAEEEWLATALQYLSRGKIGPPERNDEGAINTLERKGLDPLTLAKQLQTLVDIARWL